FNMQGYQNKGFPIYHKPHCIGGSGKLPAKSSLFDGCNLFIGYNQFAGQPGKFNFSGIKQKCQAFIISFISSTYIGNDKAPVAAHKFEHMAKCFQITLYLLILNNIKSG